MQHHAKTATLLAGQLQTATSGQVGRLGLAHGGGAEPSTGTIKLECLRGGGTRVRNCSGLRISHAQQLEEYPGDMGYEYLQTLVEKPVVWLSRRFLEI